MIPVCTPHLNQDIINAVVECLESGWIGQNKKVDEFEQAFCDKFRFHHAVAVNSCTSALRLALAIAGVGIHDEVITTPNTFVATNTAILEQGAIPVFADIQYDTGNIDPDDIERKMTRRTKAIMIVHFMGYPCDQYDIYQVADGLPVIEDCAQAIGASFDGHAVGNHRFGCFSFQTVKQITTVDGGMLTTSSDSVYEEAQTRSWFGFSKKSRSSSAHTGVCDYDIPLLGFKYKMNAVTAAMGKAQLKYVDRLIAIRQLKASLYREELYGAKGVTLFRAPSAIARSGTYMYPIHVERRPAFLKTMREKGIEAFVHNFRNDRFSVFGVQGKYDLPNMAKFDETYVCLPIHQGVTLEQLYHIIDAIKEGW